MRWRAGARRRSFGAAEAPAPAGCGQRYADLIQAPNGGTAQDPTGGKPWASAADVGAWLGTAKAIFGKVRSAWNALMDAENARGDHTASRRIRAFVESYERAYASLPEQGFFGLSESGALAEIVANCQAGACALELLEDAAAQVPGASPMPVPYQPPPPPPSSGPFDIFGRLGGVLPWILVGLVALYVLRRRE